MTDPTPPAADPASSTLLTDPPAATDPAPADPAPAADPAAPAADPKPADDPKPAEPPGAPEAYEFVPPEGHVLDEGVIGKFSEVAKELNLPQDKAQKVLDVMAPAIAERQQAALQAMTSEWAEASKADKEFGGEKLGENLAIAKTALDKFATPEFTKLLNDTGLGNHPEVLRVFYRAGKAISADTVVTGKQAPAPADRLAALYDNTPKS